MVDCLHGATPEAGCRAEQAVQPGVVDHPDDRGNPTTFLADQLPTSATELDLGGRERACAELVLEALELHSLASLDEKAGEAPGRLGEHQEDVAGRIRAKPF